ncbi:glycosyltransferase family 2 protein [Candidatus Galacturonibacter soehngenii]|uniref:Glycosyltransferase family 2 protein n=1 Tax=Candidatus Galacturonatibacter soehngenii TaxID=2307010 RepID=A0A7V7QKE8_9FIRM|nr:glycosyltransferase family A protein [Candidatus Galacturonibacter soehngenii]KAB1438248.1 glycosyltransferase family 2 protein [Candidatus Galacturonibacter soehngenii]
MQDIMISIIVPIYNSEKTLERCINSVLKQEFRDIELILINDGSIDTSLQICRMFEETDSRVRVVDNSNKGVSFSRNYGIENCVGEYIFFLDADDWLAEGALKKISLTLEKHPDIVFTSFYKEYRYKHQYITISEKEEAVYTCCEKEFNPYHTRILGTVWGKLYRREFIGNNRFNEDLNLCEDAEFNYRLIKGAKLMIYLNFASYHYVYSSSSTIRMYNPKQLMQYQKALIEIRKTVVSLSEDEITSYYIFVCNVFAVLVMNNIFSINNKKTFNEKKKILYDIYENEIFKEGINNVKICMLPKPQKVLVKLARKRKNFLIYILSIVNNIRGKILYQ